jgi:trimethylamine--corrinoid protein Co-methyltransferase
VARISKPLEFLSPDEMQRIHGAAVEILEKTGMTIDHDEALTRLEDFGCRVDRDKRHAWFPAAVTEEAVARMRLAYSDPDRMPARMSVRYSHIRFRSEPHRVHSDFSVSTGGFCLFIYDLEGKRRSATTRDVRDALKLADRLPNIDFTGLPVSAQDVPAVIRPVKMAAELARATRKLGGVEVFREEDVDYLTRIAEVVAGGREALRKNPVMVGYGEARTPLCIDRNMAGIMMAYLKRGLPQTLDTMPNAGATAPATLAGVLALGCAETLGGLILGYAVDPAAVIGVDIIPSHINMRSGLFQYSGFGRMPYLIARVQMISQFYGCPSGVHGGKTDACVPGLQVGADKVMSIILPVLAGAPGIGTVGHLENAVTFSPVQLVIDDALCGGMRHLLKEFDINEDTLGVDVIDECAGKRSFLDHDHTLEHWRDEMWFHKLFDSNPWDAAWAQELKTAEERAAAEVKRLLAEESEPVLTRDQERAIDEIVKEAEADCGL